MSKCEKMNSKVLTLDVNFVAHRLTMIMINYLPTLYEERLLFAAHKIGSSDTDSVCKY